MQIKLWFLNEENENKFMIANISLMLSLNKNSVMEFDERHDIT